MEDEYVLEGKEKQKTLEGILKKNLIKVCCLKLLLTTTCYQQRKKILRLAVDSSLRVMQSRRQVFIFFLFHVFI